MEPFEPPPLDLPLWTTCVQQACFVGLSLLCSKICLLCFLAFHQFSAYYACFYAFQKCIMLLFWCVF